MRIRHAYTRFAVRARAFVTALALIAALAAAAPPPASASCAGAASLTVDTTRRSSGTELLAVTLSAAGVLTLDVSAPADGIQPRIEFLGTTSTCTAAAGEGTDFDYVQQRPKWVAARIDTTSSTTYYLRISPQDSKQSLGDYNLRTAWMPDVSTPDETTDLSPDATDTCSGSSDSITASGVDDDYLVVVSDAAGQWDPDIMRLTVDVPGVVLIENDDVLGPELNATLYPSTACGNGTELGQELFDGSSGRILAVVQEAVHVLWLDNHDSSSGDYEVAVRFFAPCDRGETDDHGSAARCATPVSLGGSPTGSISNATDDDEDWFTFVVASQKTVEIETSGSTDTRGSLYDAGGQRLEVQDGGGSGSNFRIARTVGPGRYYIRVEGTNGAEGSYTLDVDEDV